MDDHRPAGRRDLSSERAKGLAEEVQAKVSIPNVSFEFRATIGHRGVLVLRSSEGPLSAEVENSDPAYGRVGVLGVAKETFENYVVHVTPVAGYESDERHTAGCTPHERMAAGVA